MKCPLQNYYIIFPRYQIWLTGVLSVAKGRLLYIIILIFTDIPIIRNYCLYSIQLYQLNSLETYSQDSDENMFLGFKFCGRSAVKERTFIYFQVYASVDVEFLLPYRKTSTRILKQDLKIWVNMSSILSVSFLTSRVSSQTLLY